MVKLACLAAALLFIGASSSTIGTRVANVNTGTASELDALYGVGPAIAARVVAFREAQGPFAKITDVAQVSGLSSASVARMLKHSADRPEQYAEPIASPAAPAFGVNHFNVAESSTPSAKTFWWDFTHPNAVKTATTAEAKCDCIPGYHDALDITCHVAPGGHIRVSHPHMVCTKGFRTTTDVRNPDRCLHRHWTGTEGVNFHRCKLLSDDKSSCTCCDCKDGSHHLCPAGKHRNLPTGACDSCGIGRFTAAENDQGECDACDVGTFTNTRATVTCESCPEGKFQPAKQSTSCIAAKAGTYTKAKKATTYLECAKGTYQSHENQSGCMLCSAGTFAAGTGATACDVCGPETWQPHTGQPSCRPAEQCSAV
jgi:competence ComEA-like helix-hairpin-helix protein